MYDIRAYFEDWNWWDYSWTIVASVVGTWLGLHWGEGGWQTTLSIITMLTGLWCVILVAKGRILNYPIGIVNILGYSWISYQYQLYGETMLNMLYYLPMSFVGWWIWARNKNVDVPDAVKVKGLPWSYRTYWLAISVLSVYGYGVILRMMEDPLPFLDSTSTVLSIIAMMLMAFRYMEQWVLWITVDVVSVWMWWLTLQENGNADIAVLVMWIAFLVNAIYGFASWTRMIKKERINET